MEYTVTTGDHVPSQLDDLDFQQVGIRVQSILEENPQSRITVWVGLRTPIIDSNPNSTVVLKENGMLGWGLPSNVKHLEWYFLYIHIALKRMELENEKTTE